MSASVLYVEDGPDDVFFMQRAFKKVAPDVELKVITDGQKASDFFVSSQADASAMPLSLVILDLNLPGESGFKVLSNIRSKSKYPKVPVILFSASNQQSDIEAGYAEGCNAYLVKPSEPDRLKEIVAAINDFWVKANHCSKAL
jgi:CheY-like chemotaxis protein